jgi:hypothetical protein
MTEDNLKNVSNQSEKHGGSLKLNPTLVFDNLDDLKKRIDDNIPPMRQALDDTIQIFKEENNKINGLVKLMEESIAKIKPQEDTSKINIKIDDLLTRIDTFQYWKVEPDNIKSTETYREVLDNMYDEIKGKIDFFNKEYLGSLAMALIIFLIGVGFMFYTIFWSQLDIDKYLIPKVTFVIFLELTCFLFFKHANKTLNFLQFMNNELTAIKFKKLALITALAYGDADMIRTIVEEFGKVDRNFKREDEKDANLGEISKNLTDIVKELKNN